MLPLNPSPVLLGLVHLEKLGPGQQLHHHACNEHFVASGDSYSAERCCDLQLNAVPCSALPPDLRLQSERCPAPSECRGSMQGSRASSRKGPRTVQGSVMAKAIREFQCKKAENICLAANLLTPKLASKQRWICWPRCRTASRVGFSADQALNSSFKVHFTDLPGSRPSATSVTLTKGEQGTEFDSTPRRRTTRCPSTRSSHGRGSSNSASAMPQAH